MASSADGLSELIQNYIAEPEKNGNKLTEKLFALITDNSVRTRISKSAGPNLHQISVSIEHLVDEVRHDAVLNFLKRLNEKGFDARSDKQSAAFVFWGVSLAAKNLVIHHLGKREPDGSRDKGLTRSPFKWGADKKENQGSKADWEEAAAVDLKSRDPAFSETDLFRLLEELRTSDPDLYKCLQLFAEGYTQKQIAERIGVDERTIRNRMTKLRNAHSNTD